MAEINYQISLGIGTPASIPRFITFGLLSDVIGIINLDARGRLGNLDVDSRVAQTARGGRVALDMDNRDD